MCLGLLYDANSVSGYIGAMAGEWWIGKDLEGNSRGVVNLLYRNFPGMTQETIGKIRDDTPCLGRDSNWEPPEQNKRMTESINTQGCPWCTQGETRNK